MASNKRANLSSVVGQGKKVVTRGGGRPSVPSRVSKGAAGASQYGTRAGAHGAQRTANRKAAARAMAAGIVGSQDPGSTTPMKGY